MVEKAYDVLLAAPCDERMSPFFDNIVQGIESMGRKVYTTYRAETAISNSVGMRYPQILMSDLAVCCLTPISEDVDRAIYEASRSTTPFVFISRTGERVSESARKLVGSVVTKGTINFSNCSDGFAVQGVKDAVSYFFDTCGKNIEKRRRLIRQLGEVGFLSPLSLRDLRGSN